MMKRDNLLKLHRVSLPVILVLQAFLLTFGIQQITFAEEDLAVGLFRMESLYYLLYNLFAFFILLLAFFCLFKRVLPGYLLIGVLTGILSIVNNMKWEALNECVTASDFSKLSEALKVAKDAEFIVGRGLWYAVAAEILSIFIWLYFDLLVYSSLYKEKAAMDIYRKVLLVSVILFIPFFALNVKQSEIAKLTEARGADQTGPFVYFLESMATLPMEKEYTVEEALNSYQSYVEEGKSLFEEDNGNSDATPNIIVIMSEAFYDVNRFEGAVSYSENPMKEFEELTKEGLSGNVMVNVYGGSTHFSEFEFLTGWNSKGMNSGACPYKEAFNDEQPSLARYLQEAGYYTLAVHPYNGTFYNRNRAYPRMGFSKFVDRGQMKYTDKCGYISDDSLTNEIIYQYEKKKGEQPFFCFGVSMANHITPINGELKENAPDDIQVTFHNEDAGYSESQKKWFGEYISGIAKSGEALKKLTDYFRNQEEPTVVVFFGDHAPSYALDMLKVGGKDEILAYSTPYLIWSNYDLGENVAGKVSGTMEAGMDMTASFLSTYMLEMLQMPLPDQCYYNVALQHAYPVETRYRIENADHVLYEDFTKEQREQYFTHALDLKKQVQSLVENPESTKEIWKYQK